MSERKNTNVGDNAGHDESGETKIGIRALNERTTMSWTDLKFVGTLKHGRSSILEFWWASWKEAWRAKTKRITFAR